MSVEPTDAASRQVSVERMIVLGTAVALIGAMLYIVIGKVALDEQSSGIVRILVALMAGMIGAFLPGAVFEVDKLWGLPLRAGGAAAFFAITLWAYDPQPAAPPLELLPMSVDIRSRLGFADAGAAYTAAAPMIVVSLAFRPDAIKRPIVITALSAELAFADQLIRFVPVHLTKLSEGSSGTGWLPNDGDLALPIEFPALGRTEIAYYPIGPSEKWATFAARLSKAAIVRVRLDMTTSRGTITKDCRIDFQGWGAKMIDFAAVQHRPVNRISLQCED